MEERVALYDAAGRPRGTAPRSRMRAENLRHGATGVVVRDAWGRVYLHRRTDTKDVYPGRLDFTAGGVLAAGEDPEAGARRELEEELGVAGVPLVPLGEGDYADEHTDYHAFRYTVTWSGPVRWQPEEVAWGDWVTLEDLDALLRDRPGDVMPDAAALFADWLRARLADRRQPEQGWDCETTFVEGRWVDRRPRRPEVAEQLRREAALLPRLADRLSLAVPRAVVLDEEPLRVRHVLVPGEQCRPAALVAADGTAVGRFLRELHDTPPAVWASAGLRPAEQQRAWLRGQLADLETRVLPLLPEAYRQEAAALLADVGAPYDAVLVHGDLGPDHLLVVDGRVSGVIDWGDLHLGDAALDLAWTLHGTPPAFADALASAYGVTAERHRRGLLWHRLGPWWEVQAGLDHLGERFVASGLAGVLERLPSS
ncbi:MAG: phosphotransferase [Nocardioides sp.]